MTDIEKKILDIFKMPQLLSFATIDEKGNPWVRYVVGVMDESLTLRFTTSLLSRKIAHIKANPNVHVTAGAGFPPEQTRSYIQFVGKASVSTEAKEKQAMWNDMLKAYFTGVDDPNYCVVILEPEKIEYFTMATMQPEVWEK